MSKLISKIQYTATAVDDIQKALDELGANVTNANLLEYGDIIRNLFKNGGGHGNISNQNTVKLNAFILSNDIVFFKHFIDGKQRFVQSNISIFDYKNISTTIKNTMSLNAEKLSSNAISGKIMYKGTILTNNVQKYNLPIEYYYQHPVSQTYDIAQKILAFTENDVSKKEV